MKTPVRTKEQVTNNNVETEYKRLKKLFDGAEAGKAELVDELLKKASFLKVELDRLEKDISKTYVVQTSTKGNQRMNLNYKVYLQSLATYQSIIKTLNSILGTQVEEGDDEFDKFIESLGK